MQLSGVAMNCDKQTSTFTLDIEQYISAFKEAKNFKPTTLLTCNIPDSPKYKQGKPIPYNRRYVTVSGFLSDVTYKKNTVDVVEHFNITVELIIFQGQLPASGGIGTIPNKLDHSKSS